MTWRAPLCAASLLGAAAASAEEIPAEALTELPQADVIILGELHDNPYHHANQAMAVAALEPAAIVFEMLTPELAKAVTPDLRGDRSALAAALDWQDRGWPDFAMYHPIFTAAPGAAIIGGGLPQGVVRETVGAGAEAVFAQEIDAVAGRRLGLDRDLPEDRQDEREQLQARAHCDALPEDMLSGMVEAQRLRDAALAHATMTAAEKGPVVMITGNGHARTDWGVPAKLERAAPELSVLSIGQLEAAPDAPQPYDHWVITDAPERDDPCGAFR